MLRIQLAIALTVSIFGLLFSSYSTMTNSSHDGQALIDPSNSHPPSVHQEASPSGMITGRVLNSEGRTVSQADVYAEPEGFTIGLRPFSITDEKGRFLIKGLRPGVYKVYASKELDGYPRPYSAFHMGNKALELKAVVSEGQTTHIVVNLAAKAATLIGKIVDATTGEPVVNARIILRRVDNLNFYMMTGPNQRGSFKILVPTDAFTVEISAPEYENKVLSSLVVAKGMTKRLDISLRPAN